MIEQERLKKLAPIVEKAVIETFELARKDEKNPNNFVLLLANAFKLESISKNYEKNT